ncbi:helix-turn-helix domain-containing protein [Pseudonocardia sp. CA-107938]|uniref:helix-turn-helix domain-containing protein n=1 Tax=Pseudonocardia sp. CA-107938 TaxID=3240021 RepID=UPI003D8B7477
MTSPFGTARQRTLGALLRRLRKQAGLSGTALAKQLAVSQSHLSRVELGAAAATRELVASWLDVTGASTADRTTVTELSERVAAEFGTWREALAGGLAKVQREYATAGAAATTFMTFVPGLVPGLLQTPEYAYQLMARDNDPDLDIAEAVAARMQRQSILTDRSKQLRFVIAETALLWRMGPAGVMAAQLDRLASLAADPRLDVRVLPFANTGPIWHDHGFTIYADRADGEPDLVNIELLTGPMNVRDPDQVRQYREAYERLAALSVGGGDAVDLILRIKRESYPDS